jgi:hypothetical protein
LSRQNFVPFKHQRHLTADQVFQFFLEIPAIRCLAAVT